SSAASRRRTGPSLPNGSWFSLTPSSLAVLPTAQNEAVGELGLARLLALGELPPGRTRVPAAGGLAFTAAHRMVDRIHRHAADVGTAPQPPGLSRLADHDVLV